MLVEAGPVLSGAFLNQGLADELIVYLAPVLLGPDARGMASLPLIGQLADARRYRLIAVDPVGDDLRLRLRPAPTP